MIKFTIISVLAVLVAACARRAVAQNDLLQQVEFAWEGQRSAIVSAEIQYRYMAIRGDNSLTPVDVAELFAAHDLEQDSSLFEPVLRVLAPTLPIDKPAWMNAKLRMSVDRIGDRITSLFSGIERR